MSDQPKALRMADELDGLCSQYDSEIASELRRLHALNAELVEALRCADAMLSGANMDAKAVERKVAAALAKMEASK